MVKWKHILTKLRQLQAKSKGVKESRVPFASLTSLLTKVTKQIKAWQAKTAKTSSTKKPKNSGFSLGRAVGVISAKEKTCAAVLIRSLSGWHVETYQEVSSRCSDDGNSLAALAEQHSQIPVSNAIPGQLAFYHTLPEQKTTKDTRALLAEAFKSPASFVNTLGYDQYRCIIGQKKFTHLFAARRQTVSVALESWPNDNNDNKTIDLIPWILVRWSLRFNKLRHLKPECHLRLFRMPDSRLLVFMYGKAPLIWQHYEEKEAKQEEAELQSIVNRFNIYVQQTFDLSPPKHLEVFGKEAPPELKLNNNGVDMPILNIKPALLDNQQLTTIVATINAGSSAFTLNLARRFQKPLSWKALFPRTKAMVLGVLVIINALLLFNQFTTAKRKFTALKMLSPGLTTVHPTQTFTLQQDRDKAFDAATQLADFLDSNVAWAPILEKAAELLPDNAWLINIRTTNQVFMKKAKSQLGNRYALIQGAAAFPSRDEAPEEIEKALAAFRDDETITAVFPVVQLTSVKWKKEKGDDVAYFTILCQPKKTKRRRKRT